MKKYFNLYPAILIAILWADVNYGDYLEVHRRAAIKTEAGSGAEIIERVEPQTCVELLNEGRQENGYYQVRAPGTQESGYIYRTFVRRYYGDMPVPETEESIIRSLADPRLRFTEELRRHAIRHLSIGKPQAVHERVLEGYVLGHDGRLKIPVWVQYELGRGDLTGTAARKDDFRADASIPFRYRAELDDYEDSGFDRGHMAPAGDMNRSEKVMSESFLLSNMAPQVGEGFNQNIWRDLETAVRGWVQERGRLTIITGPIFAVENSRVSYGVIGRNNVAVPTHFYKIVVDNNDPDNVQALAFMMPNRALSGENYADYLTTIDAIETAAGIDFLSALPAAVQHTVESNRAQGLW
ncbi:MAG: DNA/RNA non-specific endonuclease [Planctomycetes bacterium]|nr:DNA/RNA non-specific endonuclease [Planctomycetota bacterium]MBL7144015.1 DNA/RNA non-specific endonuclease [Phycisphaerae bacterium]